MLTKLVRPGETVELTALDRTAKKATEQSSYRTKIYDISDDEQLEIMMPMEQSKLILLPVDAEYTMCFYTRNGLYQCTGKVIDRYKNNSVYTLLFEVTSDIKKHQRREYYRYSCILPIFARDLMKEELEAMARGELYIEEGIPLREATVVDISGGGIRFVGSNQYKKNSDIFLIFELLYRGKPRKYKVIGRVLRTRNMPNQSDLFEHSVQYMRISKEAREEIIQYIFEEERKNRKKEKG
ncbi:MAG: flagellar brake protein [Lachnospiraceae bacterium]|jgi:c-di-GMP-binding flagellar brake protein YcgR|nr:flagellar brake protein [Lachnospiraceae bacterium]